MRTLYTIKQQYCHGYQELLFGNAYTPYRFWNCHYASIKFRDSKVHGANMGPTWVLSAQMGPMLAPWTLPSGFTFNLYVDVSHTDLYWYDAIRYNIVLHTP